MSLKAIEAEEARRVPQPLANETPLIPVTPPRPFDPRTEVSADAKYIVEQIVLWFLALPAVIGILVWAVTR